MTPPPGVLSRRATLAVLALTAGSIVATEVLLTRVLSVTAYYGLAFAILALAMLGLSAGALAAARARRRGDPLGPWLAQRLVACAGCVIAAAVVTATVPMTFVPNLSSFFAVLLITAACAAPMVAGGAIVARIGESPMSVSALYGVDLASAALGALAPLVVGLTLLGPALLRALRSRSPDLPGPRAAVYFGCLGAGFMMVEMALVQRMHVVLGHPSYALVVVLAGLLFATGVGSAISPFVLRTPASVGVATLAASLVLVLLPYVVIGPLARATLESGLALHAAWTGATAALVGLLLGMLFPSAIRYADREAGVPVALAISGFTSVLGSAAAIVVSVWAGISATFVAAAVVYLVAGIAGPAGWRTSGALADASR